MEQKIEGFMLEKIILNTHIINGFLLERVHGIMSCSPIFKCQLSKFTDIKNAEKERFVFIFFFFFFSGLYNHVGHKFFSG